MIGQAVPQLAANMQWQASMSAVTHSMVGSLRAMHGVWQAEPLLLVVRSLFRAKSCGCGQPVGVRPPVNLSDGRMSAMMCLYGGVRGRAWSCFCVSYGCHLLAWSPGELQALLSLL
jgi:hypothetical protein